MAEGPVRRDQATRSWQRVGTASGYPGRWWMGLSLTMEPLHGTSPLGPQPQQATEPGVTSIVETLMGLGQKGTRPIQRVVLTAPILHRLSVDQSPQLKYGRGWRASPKVGRLRPARCPKVLRTCLQQGSTTDFWPRTRWRG